MLTQLVIVKAKPREKAYKLSDGDGLVLLVQPNGSKHWRLRYFYGAKEKMLSLGAFPMVSLAEAREKRDDAHRLLAKAIDPSQERKAQKLATTNTFGGIAEELLEKVKAEGRTYLTISKKRWLLDLCSPLVKRPVAQITAAEVLDILRRIEKSGRRETAHRLRGFIGEVFRFAIATTRAENDPTYALRGALPKVNTVHRAAITDETKLGALWANINEYDGWPVVKAALQLTLLTMMRPGEVRHMKRPEIVFPRALWRVPAERMKMRRPHDVPLSRQALAVLQGVWGLSRHELVLPSLRSPLKPLSENAMNSALRRMGYTKDEVTSHGFRASASTILNDRFPHWADSIEAALAHQDEDEVRRAYNRGAYFEQRVEIMQTWADLLDEFCTTQMKSGTA